jgi:hypothetical protein
MKLHFLLLTFFIFPSSSQQQAIMGDSSSSSDSDSESESDPNTPITAPATTNDATAATSEAPPTAGGDQEGNQQNKAPRRTHSIAHNDFEDKNIVLFNVDLETGGNDCGPVQISVAASDPQNKTSLEEFDSCVKPAIDAEWSQRAMMCMASSQANKGSRMLAKLKLSGMTCCNILKGC